MDVKAITLYVCEYCGTQYKVKEDAQKCAKNHKVPKEIKNCRYISIKNECTGYPTTIDVVFGDGTTRTYKR